MTIYTNKDIITYKTQRLLSCVGTSKHKLDSWIIFVHHSPGLARTLRHQVFFGDICGRENSKKEFFFEMKLFEIRPHNIQPIGLYVVKALPFKRRPGAYRFHHTLKMPRQKREAVMAVMAVIKHEVLKSVMKSSI